MAATFSSTSRTVRFDNYDQHAVGDHYVASINTAGGDSSTANQMVGTIGFRTRF